MQLAVQPVAPLAVPLAGLGQPVEHPDCVWSLPSPSLFRASTQTVGCASPRLPGPLVGSAGRMAGNGFHSPAPVGAP